MSAIEHLLHGIADGQLKVVDLSKPLSEETPIIRLPPHLADAPPFSKKVICRYDDRGPAWYWNSIHLGEHTGTHFDAPVHWVTGRDLPNNTCDTIPAQAFVAPAAVIDATVQVASSSDYLLDPDALRNWEKKYAQIPPRSWVLMRSDWSLRADAKSFLNTSDDGPHSPGFDRSAVEFLISERDISGIGVETVGIDPGQAEKFDPPFPNHAAILGAGKFGLASLCNLDQLPPLGSILIAAPLKIVGGSGSPVRVFAITPS